MGQRSRLPYPALAVLLAAALASMGSSHAQEAGATEARWQGSASLALLVSDESGAPIPGAVVLLRLVDQTGGPPAVETDGAGRAVVDNLAAGEWQVDLRREGFMLYTAYLKISPESGPEVGFSSRQRTGSYWAPMEVSFYDPQARVSSLTGLPLSEKEVRQAARREARREAREAKRAERPNVARVVEPPPKPEAADEPAPGPGETRQAEPDDEALRRRERQARQEAKEAKRQASQELKREVREARRGDIARLVEEAPEAEGEPPRTEVPGEEPAAAAEAAPDAPAPETEPVATVAELPAVAPPTRGAGADRPPLEAVPAPSPEPPLPSLRANPNLRQAGACPECQPGEWSLLSEWRSASGGGAAEPCPADLETRMTRVGRILYESLPEALTAFAGAVVDLGGEDVLRLLPAAKRTAVESLLAPLVDPGGACQVLALVLPRGARYVGFRYQVGEGRIVGECPPDAGCEIPGARWLGHPVLQRSDRLTLVYAVFESTSRAERQPRLTAYFAPAEGWLPPSGRSDR